MIVVGSRPKLFKVGNRVCDDVDSLKMVASGLETENFSGDPRSGNSVRGFICFGEERA